MFKLKSLMKIQRLTDHNETSVSAVMRTGKQNKTMWKRVLNPGRRLAKLVEQVSRVKRSFKG